MRAKKEYTPEFKDQAVRFVMEIGPDESRRQACERLAPKLSVKAVTLYNWVNADRASQGPASCPAGLGRRVAFADPGVTEREP